MFYDLIIVSQSKPDLIPITQQCIDTARADTKDINIIIVEAGDPYPYDVDKIVKYSGEFNYNRALNMGLEHVKGDVHILANNDIIFHPGWSKIGDLMKLNNIHSASALAWHLESKFKAGDHVYFSYEVGYALTGWCLFMDRYCHSMIGKLDESVVFWYSDDLYAWQLKSAGIEHGLLCNIRVDHLCSKTLNEQPSRVQRAFQIGELNKYNKRRLYYAKGEGLHKVNT